MRKQFPEGPWFWPLQLSGWFLIGAASLFPAVMMLDSTESALQYVLLRTISGIALTTALRLAYRRIRDWDISMGRRTAGILACCTVCICVDQWVANWALTGSLLDMGVFGLLNYYPRAAAYLVWTMLYFTLCHWRASQRERYKVLELESENRQAELQLLKSQLNPHFFFNALNSILAEKDDPDKVESLTQSLATHLHYSLKQTGESMPLGNELKALNNYLAVEKIRFEERFEFEIVANAGVRQVVVPPMLIQPLVENAIKYGQLTSPSPLRLHIAAVLEPEIILVEVSNTGGWMDNAEMRGTGIGLANLKRRLQLIFGGKAQLIHEVKDGWVHCRLRLPRPIARGAQV